MALAWMRSGGVDQMIGYTVNQWYPRGGFGTDQLLLQRARPLHA